MLEEECRKPLVETLLLHSDITLSVGVLLPEYAESQSVEVLHLPTAAEPGRQFDTGKFASVEEIISGGGGGGGGKGGGAGLASRDIFLPYPPCRL